MPIRTWFRALPIAFESSFDLCAVELRKSKLML